MRLPLLLALLTAASAGGGCAPKPATTSSPAESATTIRVYTSMYREVIDALSPVLAERIGPRIRVEWEQAGSGKIAARLDAELASPGGSTADLLLTADPDYYRRLKDAGTLVPYRSPAAGKQPAAFRDPQGAYATVRFSTMVIGLSPELAGAKEKPASFMDLAGMEKVPASFRAIPDPSKWWRIAMGNPATSGTALTTVAVLSDRLGWEYFRALHRVRMLAAGGNSTVLQRLDTGESDAGIVLLENVLAAREAGSKVAVVYPADGAIVIPGLIALLPHAKKNEAAAAAVYDAFLSEEVQRAIVEKGFMHSPDPAMPAPTGAPSLEALLAGVEPASLYAPRKNAGEIKTLFEGIFAP